ncbi:hypothetical protein [Rhodoferax sp.]|uniref:hypothetical protein n=1 Tax=Rhodoferax sp. TaxID=50421 RepID=UPI0025E288D3|nr:hypothetical protein [Rhodoferax sp.]
MQAVTLGAWRTPIKKATLRWLFKNSEKNYFAAEAASLAASTAVAAALVAAAAASVAAEAAASAAAAAGAAAGASTTGAGAGAGSSFLPQAAKTTAAIKAASTSDLFIRKFLKEIGSRNNFRKSSA